MGSHKKNDQQVMKNPKRSAFWVLSYSFVPLDKQ